jgi:hypothetical protein
LARQRWDVPCAAEAALSMRWQFTKLALRIFARLEFRIVGVADIGQDNPGKGFDMRRENDGGLKLDDLAHADDLRPAVGKPAVADDDDGFVCRKLPRHRFHAEGAAARHESDVAAPVNRFEHAGDIAHHAAKLLAHVMERAVGRDA